MNELVGIDLILDLVIAFYLWTTAIFVIVIIVNTVSSLKFRSFLFSIVVQYWIFF